MTILENLDKLKEIHQSTLATALAVVENQLQGMDYKIQRDERTNLPIGFSVVVRSRVFHIRFAYKCPSDGRRLVRDQDWTIVVNVFADESICAILSSLVDDFGYDFATYLFKQEM